MGGSYPLWHLGLAAVTLAFNFGTFILEYLVIVLQGRLLLEIKTQADRMREERAAISRPS